MQIPYITHEQPLTLKISVTTPRRERIVVRVLDAQKIPGTNVPIAVYEDRYQDVYGQSTFFVKMPVSPQTALIQVFNAKRGNLPDGQDSSFHWKLTALDLHRTIMPIHIPQKRAREFMLFIEDFAKNKNLISAGYGNTPNSIYKSASGNFEVHYYDVLRDVQPYVVDYRTRQYVLGANGKPVPNPNFMRPVTTPMRTQADTGIFEISKQYIQGYTVPEIIAIGAHEFSHVNVNQNPADEEEADRNAASIVLSCGYGKIPTYNAFLKVFRNADSKGNRQREQKLYDFIQKFEVGNTFLVA